MSLNPFSRKEEGFIEEGGRIHRGRRKDSSRKEEGGRRNETLILAQSLKSNAYEIEMVNH